MEFIKVEKSEHVAIVTIDRPEALNALNNTVLQELAAVLEGVEKNINTKANIAENVAAAEPEVRCLIITGAGEKAFIAGADISEMSSFTKAEGEAFGKMGNDLFLQIENFPVPIIAVINGFALGGGCELAMSCDIRICSDNARFGQPEVGLGITPGFGGTQRLARIVGVGKAKEMLYTARIIDAKEACRIGLVEQSYPQEQLMEEGKKLAARIAGNAPIAVRNCKAAVNQGIHKRIGKAVEVEEKLFGDCFETLDQQDGMRGFLEKQKNIVFQNR